MVKDIEWDAQQIAALNIDQVRKLRANAEKLGKEQVITLCDADLASRLPAKKDVQKLKRPPASKPGRYVVGFHFKCARDQGVSFNSDGTFWSGTWVVDESHAARGVEINAYVALHERKSELSYRQGLIKGWRKVEREEKYADRPVKIKSGIDFLLAPTSDPFQWVGAGAGEKGYAWGGN